MDILYVPCTIIYLGILDSPVDISAECDYNECHISWLPPFILEGISVNYTVQGSCLTSSGVQTGNQSETTNDQTILLKMNETSCCTIKYTVCVWAVTEAGEGEPGCVNASSIEG